MGCYNFYLPFLSLRLLPFFSSSSSSLFIYLFIYLCLFIYLFIFMGRLHGLWVAQLVGLVMGFGEFLIRVVVVFGWCWWFSVDVVGFSDGDYERITGLWFWWVVFLFPIVGGDEVVGLGLWFWWVIFLFLLSASLWWWGCGFGFVILVVGDCGCGRWWQWHLL